LRQVRSLAAILLAVSLVANGQDVRSWRNLDSIATGPDSVPRPITRTMWTEETARILERGEVVPGHLASS